MKRIYTALALASLFASVPAFAKSHVSKPISKPAAVSVAATKTEEAKPAEGDKTAKPKKTKKTPKKTEAAPEAAPAK